MRFSSTRFDPLVSTRTGLPLSPPLKINDLTICPSAQPTRSAASCAVRVLSLNSITVHSAKPCARRASCIFWAEGERGALIWKFPFDRSLLWFDFSEKPGAQRKEQDQDGGAGKDPFDAVDRHQKARRQGGLGREGQQQRQDAHVFEQVEQPGAEGHQVQALHPAVLVKGALQQESDQ